MATEITAQLNGAGADFVDRANRLLDQIEHSVLPSDPATAFQMLTELIGHNVFDGKHWTPGITQLFKRAIHLARTATLEAPHDRATVKDTKPPGRS